MNNQRSKPQNLMNTQLSKQRSNPYLLAFPLITPPTPHQKHQIYPRKLPIVEPKYVISTKATNCRTIL